MGFILDLSLRKKSRRIEEANGGKGGLEKARVRTIHIVLCVGVTDTLTCSLIQGGWIMYMESLL